MVLERPPSADPAGSRKVDAWWRDNAGRVRAFLVHQTDESVADDLLAEVFIIALRRHAIVPEPPIGWLLLTARHIVANYRRGTKRYKGMVERVAAEQGRRPMTVAGADADERAMLESLLEGMSALDREVLTLSAWYGLTPAEAAEALDIKVNAYNVRLHRARTRLDERWKSRGEDGAS